MGLFFKRCAARILPRSFIVAATVGIVVFLNVPSADAKLGSAADVEEISALSSHQPHCAATDGNCWWSGT
jgi:hypothetical protein